MLANVSRVALEDDYTDTSLLILAKSCSLFQECGRSLSVVFLPRRILYQNTIKFLLPGNFSSLKMSAFRDARKGNYLNENQCGTDIKAKF